MLLANGTSVFVKSAVDAATAVAVATEWTTYQTIVADCMPQVIGFIEDGHGTLVLEDLSSAFWPPPWRDADLRTALDTLETVATLNPGTAFEHLQDRRPLLLGWQRLARDPQPFVRLNMKSQSWLEAHLSTLLILEDRAKLDGQSVVHGDLRSDNVCFAGSTCRFIDWAGTAVGNSRYDTTMLAVSMEADDFPPKHHWTTDGDLELVALHAGYLASRAGLPDPYLNSPVRPMQRHQLKAALSLLTRLLGDT